jgi:excisionase family DNA binding protein
MLKTMATTSKLSTSVKSSERGLAMTSRKFFARHTTSSGGVRFLSHEGKAKEEVVIPPEAARLIKVILAEMEEGRTVSVNSSAEREITTQEAAGLLKVSRPFLVKLLETGQIPFRKVGSRRRVLAKDVLSYKKSTDSMRGRVLEKLAKQAQELNMGY